jgi:hypothetical protein
MRTSMNAERCMRERVGMSERVAGWSWSILCMCEGKREGLVDGWMVGSGGVQRKGGIKEVK